MFYSKDPRLQEAFDKGTAFGIGKERVRKLTFDLKIFRMSDQKKCYMLNTETKRISGLGPDIKEYKEPKGFRLDKVSVALPSDPLPDGHQEMQERNKLGFPSLKANIGEEIHKQTAYDSQSETGQKVNKYLYRYSNGSRSLNNAIREGKPLSSDLQERLDEMDSYFSAPEHKLTAPITVLRGIDNSSVCKKMIRDGVFSDEGYVSTSTSFKTAARFMRRNKDNNQYLFSLNVPKGYGAVSLIEFNKPNEREILLQRKIKGKITHVEKIVNNRGGFDFVSYVDLDPIS